MSDIIIPHDIFIITRGKQSDGHMEPRRGSATNAVTSGLLATQPVHIDDLKEQINIFLNQLNVVMSETPEKIGDFKLSEFEVTAGITVQGNGEIKLALIASGEISGGVNAGLKFVFKRS